eukprot:Rhum_TRINITY_DN14425_c31_g1::Rhum_TRINITY_DN14425_c31_g1_i1::g.90202::m.90202
MQFVRGLRWFLQHPNAENALTCTLRRHESLNNGATRRKLREDVRRVQVEGACLLLHNPVDEHRHPQRIRFPVLQQELPCRPVRRRKRIRVRLRRHNPRRKLLRVAVPRFAVNAPRRVAQLPQLHLREHLQPRALAPRAFLERTLALHLLRAPRVRRWRRRRGRRRRHLRILPARRPAAPAAAAARRRRRRRGAHRRRRCGGRSLPPLRLPAQLLALRVHLAHRAGDDAHHQDRDAVQVLHTARDEPLLLLLQGAEGRLLGARQLAALALALLAEATRLVVLRARPVHLLLRHARRPRRRTWRLRRRAAAAATGRTQRTHKRQLHLQPAGQKAAAAALLCAARP